MNIINAIDGFLPWVFSNIANPVLDWFMVFFTTLGEGGVLWIALTIVMLITKKYRKVGIISAISLAVCFLPGNYIIKPLVARIRPCNFYEGLRMIIEAPHDFSFPSMHAASSFSVAVVLARNEKKFGVWAIVAAVIISLSRVYLNVHFTTDIICGAVYGSAIALLVDFVIKKTMNRRQDS